MPDILRSEKGGYDKSQALMKIQAYNLLLMTIENGMSYNEAMNELERLRAMPINTVKSGGFFSKSGFSREDTDAYIAKLENQIIDALK